MDYPVCIELEAVDDSLVWRNACENSYLSQGDCNELLHELDIALGFLVSSPNADVLSFDGDEVSVCGLPSFPLRVPDQETVPLPSQTAGSDDWLPAEIVIRSVLADISGISASAIKRSHTVYNIGLDSISSIKASSMLRKRGLPLGVRDMLTALVNYANGCNRRRSSKLVREGSRWRGGDITDTLGGRPASLGRGWD